MPVVDQSNPVASTSEQQAVPVAREDREFAAQWIINAPQNQRTIRAGDWDHHHAVQAAARHRLVSLPCKSGEGADHVPDLGKLVAGEDVKAQNPAALLAHLQRIPMTEWVWHDASMIFATLAALTPDATQTREAEGLTNAVDDQGRFCRHCGRASWLHYRVKGEGNLCEHPQAAADFRSALIDSLSAQLDGSYDCGRVWSAWSYSTMGEDDFSPITDRVEEIADGIIATLNARGGA